MEAGALNAFSFWLNKTRFGNYGKENPVVWGCFSLMQTVCSLAKGMATLLLLEPLLAITAK